MGRQTYGCFCANEIDIRNDYHVWTLVPQQTIVELESQVNTEDALYFLQNYSTFNAGSQEVILCPFCTGLSRAERHEDRFHTLYYLPERHFETFTLEMPEALKEFKCPCGGSVDTSSLQHQWTMMLREEAANSQMVYAIEDFGTVKAYYRALYSIGKRVITCPHCEGLTAVDCDAQGRGKSATYYALRDTWIAPFTTRIMRSYTVHTISMMSGVEPSEEYW